MNYKKIVSVVLGTTLCIGTLTACSNNQYSPIDYLLEEGTTASSQNNENLSQGTSESSGAISSNSSSSQAVTASKKEGNANIEVLAVGAITADNIQKQVSGISVVSDQVNLTAEQYKTEQNVITSTEWIDLGKRVNEVLSSDDIDGIVIMQDAETIEETAYFLNLTVKSDKPIVMITSYSSNDTLTDSESQNITNAMLVAKDESSKGKGVVLVNNGNIYSARNADDIMAQTSAQVSTDGCVGQVSQTNVKYIYEVTGKHTSQSEFDINSLKSLKDIEIVYGNYAGTSDKLFDAALNQADGIVIATYADGTFNSAILDKLNATVSYPTIVRASANANTMVEYNKNFKDSEYKTLAGGDLSVNKARVLMMVAMSTTNDYDTLVRYFSEY